MKFKVSSETKQNMIASLQNFFYKEREEDLGYIEANQLLEFFIEEFAPNFYNEGITDAHKHFQEKVNEILALQKEHED